MAAAVNSRAQKSKPDDTRTARCSICDDLICDVLDSDESNPKSYEASLESLTHSGNTGCRSCLLLSETARAFKYRLISSTAGDVFVSWHSSESKPEMYPLVITLHRRGVGYTLPLELFVGPGQESPWPAVGVQALIAEHSGSESCLSKVASWLTACCQHHDECRPREASRLPPRVLQVRSAAGTDEVRLVETSGVEGEYIALSHCWGSLQHLLPLRTTKTTIASRERSIPWDDISKTFQDAIILTRFLGVKYIWIDSLCIIQDDENDWRKHVSQMAGVYTNSLLTIASTRATSGAVGCFSARRAPQVTLSIENGTSKSFEIHARQPLEHAHFSVKKQDVELDFFRHPLFKRGWCLQERILSQRIVHFDADEVVWQCKSCVDCECGTMTRYQDKSYLAFAARFSEVVATGKVEDVLLLWSGIVQQYTAARLSQETDMLPALAGIASQFHGRGLGTYIAGLWEADLCYWLAWKTDGRGRRPLSYVAPTFSWASGIWPVEFATATAFSSDIGSFIELLSVRSGASSPFPFGEVRDSNITILGSLIDATLTTRGSTSNRTNQLHIGPLNVCVSSPYVDVEYDIEEGETSSLVYCLPLGGDIDSGTRTHPGICALLLQRAGNDGPYRRLGLVSFSNGLVIELEWLRNLPKLEITLV